MATYVVSLNGGIGNIVETVPFMWFLKDHGHVVIARVEPYAYSREACELVRNVYDEIVDSRWHVVGAVDNGWLYKEVPSKKNDRPEWEAWFEMYGMLVPSVDAVRMDTYWEDVPFQHDAVLAPTSKANLPMKSWPYWDALAGMIPGCAVVGLAGEGGDFGRGCTDLRGKLSLAQIAGLFKKAKYVVAQDGGLAHLAAANGTRTYILYGGTSWYKNFPPRNGVLVTAERLMPCQPCQFDGCHIDWEYDTHHGCRQEQKVDGRWSRCMHAITPERVMEIVRWGR